MCVSAAKIRTLKIKYETLILDFKTQLHFCRLSQLENPNELQEDQINVIEQYVALMYARGSGLGSVNACRRYLFTHKNLSSESLPPTYDALIQHLKRNLSRRVSVNHHVSSDCDFHSIPLAMLPNLFLLCSTFPIFRFALLSSYTSSQLLIGALCFKLIYLYEYLS